jgi:glycosyltransferase involved in cell wall biosynthesis
MVDVTAVIPTLKKPRSDIPTIESIPEDVPINIQRESPISTARNRGVERASTDYVVEVDDDIRFSQDLWDEVLEIVNCDTVVGMEDWDYGLLVTRLIAFPREAWVNVGGFDNNLGSHMEDTDFAIKLDRAKYELISVSQDRIEHVPHENRIDTTDRLWRLAYLCLKHPWYTPRLIKGTLS